MFYISLYFQLTAQNISVHTKIFLRGKQNFPTPLFLIPKENQDAAELMQWHQFSVLLSHTVWQFLILKLQLPEPCDNSQKTLEDNANVSPFSLRRKILKSWPCDPFQALKKIWQQTSGPFLFFSKKNPRDFGANLVISRSILLVIPECSRLATSTLPYILGAHDKETCYIS